MRTFENRPFQLAESLGYQIITGTGKNITKIMTKYMHNEIY
jgi:hypothetical protein